SGRLRAWRRWHRRVSELGHGSNVSPARGGLPQPWTGTFVQTKLDADPESRREVVRGCHGGLLGRRHLGGYVGWLLPMVANPPGRAGPPAPAANQRVAAGPWRSQARSEEVLVQLPAHPGGAPHAPWPRGPASCFSTNRPTGPGWRA